MEACLLASPDFPKQTKATAAFSAWDGRQPKGRGIGETREGAQWDTVQGGEALTSPPGWPPRQARVGWLARERNL